MVIVKIEAQSAWELWWLHMEAQNNSVLRFDGDIFKSISYKKSFINREQLNYASGRWKYYELLVRSSSKTKSSAMSTGLGSSSRNAQSSSIPV